MRNIKIIVANPAGNKTAFVLTPVEPTEYKLIGKAIFDNKEVYVEQVAFVKEFYPNPRMEMSGMEFCGNAGRAFGLLCALEKKIQGHSIIEISESGCKSKLAVEVDTLTKVANITMPLPKNVLKLDDTDIDEINGATLVDLDGIVHVVLNNTTVRASVSLFNRIKDYVIKRFDPPAVGVMFVKPNAEIVPFVYVRDVDTTYEEGSCGSGTTACAIAWSIGCKATSKSYLVKQPAGEIEVSVELSKGNVVKVTIGGPVSFSEPQNMMVKY